MMITDTPLKVLPYTRAYRPMLNDLLFFSHYMHMHLDWSHIDTWANSPDAIIRVAVRGERVLGYLGASRPIGETAWIRVAVFRDEAFTDVLLALWHTLIGDLQA